jgi:predicted N-acyltransferase
MSVQVLEGAAAQWQEYVGDDVPILASAPWIAATLGRFIGRRLTFLATEEGRGGLQATVVDSTAAGEMVNLYQTLLADPKVWKFPADSVAARSDLRAQVPPAECWLPHIAVLYPGFGSFIAASGGPTPALTATLVDAVLSWAHEHAMKAVSFPYVTSDAVLSQVLAERGFRSIPLTFRSRLTVTDSFDDYLASLSVNGRSQVTRERRHLAASGVRTQRCAFDDVWPDVVALRCDLVERYGQKADKTAEEEILRKMVSCFGADRTRLYCSFLDGRIVGYSLGLVWGDTWLVCYPGTHQSPQTRSVYFDHFVYAPVAEAIAERARVVDLGIGAWEGKRRRGCELTPVDLWVRGLDPVIEQAIGRAAAPMRREVGW